MSVCPTRGFYSTHPLKEPLGQFNHSATVLESEENIKKTEDGPKEFYRSLECRGNQLSN